MDYYHIHIVTAGGHTSDHFFLNFTKKELLQKIVRPYRSQRAIHHKGYVIKPSDVLKITIARSDLNSSSLQDRSSKQFAQAVEKSSEMGFIMTIPEYGPEHYIHKEANVTEQFIGSDMSTLQSLRQQLNNPWVVGIGTVILAALITLLL